MSSASSMCQAYPAYTSDAPEDVSTALHGSGSGEGSLCTQGHAPCGSPLCNYPHQLGCPSDLQYPSCDFVRTRRPVESMYTFSLNLKQKEGSEPTDPPLVVVALAPLGRSQARDPTRPWPIL